MDTTPTAIAQSQLVLQVITLVLVAWVFFRQKTLIKNMENKPEKPGVN